MRILHTADWHVGKRIGRHDRMADHAAVLDEVVEIAAREKVDLTIVSGDLFDRAFPPVEALKLVMDTLRRLATPERPVVVIAGNHDSPELFDLLGPLVESWSIHMAGSIKRPELGGVLDLPAGSERARVACFPFLHSGAVVDVLVGLDQQYNQYADRVAAICRAYGDALERGRDSCTVCLLVGHFIVTGARLGSGLGQRGERLLHIGEAYTATEQALPPGPSYVAMGHIHAPQHVPGHQGAAEYAGSTLELDFGEAGEAKRVVLVDAKPGLPARVESVLLTKGRRLIRAAGTLAQLVARPDLRDSFLELTIDTDGPDDSLADRAREHFPLIVAVRPRYPRRATEAMTTVRRENVRWDDLYGQYYRQAYQCEPPEALAKAFREIYEKVI